MVALQNFLQARVFDSHVGSVTNIIIRQLGSTNIWALVAAAQNGAWWRCEFEYDIILSLCKEAQDAERGFETHGPSKADGDRMGAQKALKGGPTQQAEKHQQQQQFLRRLLMLDAATYDDQPTNEVAASLNGHTSKYVTLRLRISARSSTPMLSCSNVEKNRMTDVSSPLGAIL